MLFVRVVSFEQIYSVHDTLPDLLFVKPAGKISVILPALCYGGIGMYWHEVFLSERALWGRIYFCSGAGFISASKHFVRGQPTKGCWSHLYLGVQGCPCSRARDISQHQLPSRASTGTSEHQGIVRNKVKHRVSNTYSLNLTIPIFTQYSWFSNVSLPFSHDDSGLFFLFSGWKQGPAEGFHCMFLMMISGLQFCVFPPQTLSHGECYQWSILFFLQLININ